MPRALITGFGPFPGVRRNPSGEIMRRLASDARWARLGWRVDGLLFPTGYAEVGRLVDAQAALSPAPDLIVMLGVAARARALRVELRATNRVSRQHRDATGARPAGRLLEKGGAVTRSGRHPGTVLVTSLRAGQVPAGLSRDTGRYVCNAAYWAMLGAMPRRTRVVFVHIPMPRLAGGRRRDPRPDLATMTRALAALVMTMIRIARIRR